MGLVTIGLRRNKRDKKERDNDTVCTGFGAGWPKTCTESGTVPTPNLVQVH